MATNIIHVINSAITQLYAYTQDCMLKTTYTCSNQAKKTAMSAANSISTVSPLKIEYLLGQRGKEMVNLQIISGP